MSRQRRTLAVGRQRREQPTFWESVSNDVRTLAFLFLLPTMVVLTCVVLYPFTYALLLSFQDKTAGIPSRFIGLQNYIELLSDREFLDIFYNTVWYTVVGCRHQIHDRPRVGAGPQPAAALQQHLSHDPVHPLGDTDRHRLADLAMGLQ